MSVSILSCVICGHASELRGFTRMKKSKAFTVIEIVMIAILIILIAGMLFLYFTFSETGAAVDILGKTVYQTQAVNMQPAIPKGCAVTGDRDAVESAKTGDVVLCVIGEKQVLARIQDILNEDGINYYTMHYDTASETDVTVITQQEIIAANIRIHKGLGRLLSFATSTPGIMVVIIIPSFIIIVLQVIKIVNSKHTREESISLADLEDIMKSDDYPEETFLPADKTNDNTPDMSGMANDLSFGTVADRVDPDSSVPMGGAVPDADGIIRTGTLSDIFGETDFTPSATDIFAEDGEFFAQGATKKGFSLVDEEDVLDGPDSTEKEESSQEHPSVLASEFYGITDEVRSHEEERRILRENDVSVFEDPIDGKADSILSGLDDDALVGDAQDAQNAQASPAPTDESGFAYFNSIGDALRAAADHAAEDTATETVPADKPAYEDGSSGNDDLFDKLVSEDSTAIFTETADTASALTPAQVVYDAVSDMPVLGERPSAPAAEPEPVRKRVVKRKKVSVDDLLSIIDNEEKKLK